MQKKNIILKNNKGIALITLVVAVLMMLVIVSVIVYNAVSFVDVNKLNKMYNDIRLLNEQVLLYYGMNRNLPILDNKYASNLNEEILMSYSPDNFYVIDIDRINKNIKSNLNYGKDYYTNTYNGEDIYVINVLTHQIFYVKGIELDNVKYYTIPGENNYTKAENNSVNANPPIIENGMKSVIYNSNSIKEISQYDANWYNYSGDISNWARAKKEDNSLYMWVPRYAYNEKTNEIVFLQGTTDKPINKEDEEKLDFSTGEWLIPSAFQNKEKEQFTGIWLNIEKEYNKIKTEEELIKAVYDVTDKDNLSGEQNTTITGKVYSYYNPVIPVGFKTVPTKDASWKSSNGTQVDGWNDGLVIEDKDGNQFVWVPVNGTDVQYEKWLGTVNAKQVTEIKKLADKDFPSKIQEWYGTSNDAERVQIETYGGFYIARYEAGIPESEKNAINNANATYRNINAIPVSKRNQVAWNFIDYNKAKTNAEKMYSDNYVQSGLVTGTMWDALMLWIKNAGINVETDSTSWGNFLTSEVPNIINYSTDNAKTWKTASIKPSETEALLKTGESDYTKRKNIYDLAGNESEWVNETYDSTNNIMRGGACSDKIESSVAMYRAVAQPDTNSYKRSFRVALYIK